MARIVRLEVCVHRGMTAAPVGAVRGRSTLRAGLLVTLHDDTGRSGQGEAAPLPGYSTETLDDAIAALTTAREALLGAPLESPQRVLSRGEFRGLPGSARFALETAVFDLVARRRGVPMRSLLARVPVARLPGSAYLGAALDEGLDSAARTAVEAGFSTLKVKLGGAAETFEHELAALHALRQRLPQRVKLRLDANGAWSPAAATRALARLGPLDVEMIEQPSPVGALRALGRCAVPWAVDESLSDADDLAAALAPGSGCVAVVVKPAVHGLLGGASLAHRAKRAGKGVVVTHFFDGPIGTAAACELALALGDTHFAAGLAWHPGLSAWPTTTLAQLAVPGAVVGSARPGHGVTAIELGQP